MEIGTMSMMDISFGNNSVLKKLEKKSGNPMIHEELGNNIHIIYVYLNLPPKFFFQTLCQSPVFSVPRKLFRTYSQIQDLAILGYQW